MIALTLGLLLGGPLPTRAARLSLLTRAQDVRPYAAQNAPPPAGYISIQSPLGYQVLAPEDWQRLSLSGGDMLFRSPDKLALMDVVVTDAPTDLGGIDGIAADVVRDYRDGLRASDFQVIETAANSSVANADAALNVRAQYTSRSGIARTALFLLSVRDTMLYILVFDQSGDYLSEHADQSTRILESFMLAPR